MDQPQHQVFGTDQQSYRYMAYPFQKQPLQLLYPGRVMQQDYHYTGENIPNEDPEGLDRTRHQTAALAYAAKMEREALSKHLGGKDKIARHPAVEPEAIIEDPQLQHIGLGTSFGLNADLENVPTKSLGQVEKRGHKIVDHVRGRLRGASPDPLSEEEILPRYDWQASGAGYDRIQDDIIETYASDHHTYKSCEGNTCTTFNCDNSAQTCTSQTCSRSGGNCGSIEQCDWNQYCTPEVVDSTVGSTDSKKTTMWIVLAIIGILAIVFIALIIYGIHKHRSHAQIVQPKAYHVVPPEYLAPGMRPDITGPSPTPGLPTSLPASGYGVSHYTPTQPSSVVGPSSFTSSTIYA